MRSRIASRSISQCYAGLEVRVAVEGAKVPAATLRKLVPIYQEGAVDEDLLQEGRRSLREWFERAGYFDAQVSYTASDAPADETSHVRAPTPQEWSLIKSIAATTTDWWMWNSPAINISARIFSGAA